MVSSNLLERHEVLEVVVVELEDPVGPGPVVARPHAVAPAQGVAPAEGDDVPVVEAHAAEHLAQVRGPLAGVRQTAVGRHGWHRAFATC